MMIKVFGIKNCDTMKKTFAWFDENKLVYDFVDYKKAGVVAETLPEWSAKAGWETLLNRRGLTWKKLPEEIRAEVDASKALALMVDHPTLIKRPVIVHGDQVIVGFDTAQLASVLLK